MHEFSQLAAALAGQVDVHVGVSFNSAGYLEAARQGP